MLPKIILGIIVGAIGTNVALKTAMKTGGTIQGLGYLALGHVADTVTFIAKPFWVDMQEAASATPQHTLHP